MAETPLRSEAPQEPSLSELISSIADPKDRAQLILQQRQLDLTDFELRIKRDQLTAEQKHKVSPLTTAILAAGAAVLSATVTTTTTQIVEQRKFQLAQKEFQYGLVKDALAAPDAIERRKRLLFLKDVGLLSDFGNLGTEHQAVPEIPVPPSPKSD